MELRTELMPPALDEILVARLAKLADRLDGARPGEGEEDLEEFNRLAATTIPFEEFQGISGGEDHAAYVRRILYKRSIKPAAGVTREELIEVVRRAMLRNGGFEEHEANMMVFDANVPFEGASELIFYPPDYDPASNTWGDGRPIGEYNPSPEQVVERALARGRAADPA